MPTRRAFLKASAVSLVSFGLGGLQPAFLGRAALAAPVASSSARRKVLVALFQRGAMDGLSAVSPLGDRYLARLRPNLDLTTRRDAGGMIELGSGLGSGLGNDPGKGSGDGFALHPELGPLLDSWRDGHLAIVHGVGSPDPTRSHFDAQDYMETGTPGRKGTSSGWLNRVLGELGHEATPFRGVALTNAMPRSFYGDEPALAVARLDQFKLDTPGSRSGGMASLGVGAGGGFEALYRQTTTDLLRDTGNETFDAIEMLRSIDPGRHREAPGVRYPQTPLGQALRQIAYLIKADVGLQVAFAESGGWDTHVRQGGELGAFARNARDLASSIAAFWRDLGAHRSEVVLMTMTEFGRTVAENGSLGTDHGHGSCLFVLGEQVAGGRVLGELPPLAPENLYERRDLPVTTDFRSVFLGVAADHLGVTDRGALFPGFTGEPLRVHRV
jgi:uncharacterized protein (DUF1501 family)